MPHVTRTAVASRSCSQHPVMKRSQLILYVKDTRLAVSDLASDAGLPHGELLNTNGIANC